MLEWSDTTVHEHIASARLDLYDSLAKAEHEGPRCLSQIPSYSKCSSGPKTMASVHVHLIGALTRVLLANLIPLEMRTAPGCSSQKQWDMGGLHTLSKSFVRVTIWRGRNHGGS